METAILSTSEGNTQILFKFENSYGETVEVRSLSAGHVGDPLLNDLKKRIIAEGVSQ